MAICGYSHFDITNDSISTVGYNAFSNKSYFSWWGCGTWINRKLGDQNNLEYCRIPFYDKTTMKRVKSIPDSFKYMMLSLKSGIRCKQTDVFQTLRVLIFDYCTITPISSLVYNLGYDDSGVHKLVGRDKKLYSEIIIDNEPFTSLSLAPEDLSNKISRWIINKYSYKGEVRPWMHILCFLIKTLGYDRYLRFNHFLRKCIK